MDKSVDPKNKNANKTPEELEAKRLHKNKLRRERYKNLPEEEKNKIREKARKKSNKYRRAAGMKPQGETGEDGYVINRRAILGDEEYEKLKKKESYERGKKWRGPDIAERSKLKEDKPVPDGMVEIPERPYELAFHNSIDFVPEIIESGEHILTISIGKVLGYCGSDIVKWANLHFGRGTKWKIYVTSDNFVAEYRSDKDCSKESPTAVYPMWDARRENIIDLQDYIDNPWGESVYCFDESLPHWTRPVWGQQHKVFVKSLMGFGVPTQGDKQLVYSLSKLQEKNPQVDLFICGSASFAVLFGQSFRSGSVQLGIASNNSKFFVPGGKIQVAPDDIEKNIKTIETRGFNPELMADALGGRRERFLFSASVARESASLWHTHKRKPYRTPQGWEVDYTKPTMYAEQALIKGDVYPDPSLAKPGDFISCSHCSLWRMCSRYREGAVCTVPGTDGKNLAKHFGTTDSTSIINGLQSIMETRAKRLDRIVEEEQFQDDLDPKVDSMLSSLFKDGISLAKLTDPSLSSPMVQVNQLNAADRKAISIPSQPVSRADSRQLMAGVVAEIEAKGIDRKDITEEMIDDQIRKYTDGSGASGEVLDAEVADEIDEKNKK